MAATNHKTQQDGYLAIDDELSIYTAQALRDRLLAALATIDELELDLSGVSEFDGAGLQLLVAIKKEAGAAGKQLRISGHSPAVLDLLDFSGLAGFFGDPLLLVRN